jgi:putative oxidoreductase
MSVGHVLGAGRHDLTSSVGLLVLRVGIGGYMLTHGVGKLRMMLAGQFEMFGDPIGLGSVPSLVLVVFAELLCAILVMLGVATRFAAAVLVIEMAVAAFVAHGADPWSMETGYMRYMAGEAETWFAKEPALLYLIPFLALVFTGAGKLAVDAWLWRTRRPAEQGPQNSTTASP